MSRKIVAGNWKMNMSLQEGLQLVTDLSNSSDQFPNDVKVIVSPPASLLSAIHNNGHNGLSLSAQNCHAESSGAFTGEISPEILASCGCEYVIIGHSERRQYYHEDESVLAPKVDAVLRAGLIPIYCCGESLDQRMSQTHFNVVEHQLQHGIFHLNEGQIENVVIAYEPVWAIGTGQTATSEQAQEMHAFIRSAITEKFGEGIGKNIPILYGGSCKPDNANELFACPDVDGGLIGGASLKAEDFLAIIQANV